MPRQHLLTIVIAALICACSMKEAPDCASDKTKNLAFKIINEQVGKAYQEMKTTLSNVAAQHGAKLQGDPSSIKYSLKNTRVIEKNKDTGNFKCTGTLVAELNEENFEVPLFYTSELVDGGKDFYVEIRGLTEYKIGEIIGSLMVIK
jgi:hypothetical protein